MRHCRPSAGEALALPVNVTEAFSGAAAGATAAAGLRRAVSSDRPSLDGRDSGEWRLDVRVAR